MSKLEKNILYLLFTSDGKTRVLEKKTGKKPITPLSESE